MLKILGVGLSRTGTTSLYEALRILGYKSVHYAPHRFANAINGKKQSFRVYDDVDASTDIPAAYYYRELTKVYHDLKYILTIRDENEWFRSIDHHYKTLKLKMTLTVPDIKIRLQLTNFANKLQQLVYGSNQINKKLYCKRYKDHNLRIMAEIPPNKLLIIKSGDGWDGLCKFLNKPIPSVSYPWVNKHWKKIKLFL